MLDITPLAGALGAEIRGIDLSQALNDDTVRKLRKLLNEYQVIFFREQAISPQQQTDLAQCFGPLQQHPAYDTVAGHPAVTILESSAEKPSKIEQWHSDMTFREHPPLGTVLKAVECPARGGDTLWASMTAAYDALSAPMQSFLGGLIAVHDFSHGFRESLAEPGGRERLADAVATNPPVRHPVIRTHPETGKKVIFVNALFTTHIEGLRRSESDALLQFLFQHIQTPEFSVRFNWRPGSIAIWDNRSTQHKPVNDYFPAYRRMERITIDGDKPY
ncbi:taurine dioxygenase [Parahalioglobus pacificus]|uniref:Taurine dioxygenase n=1 Tax=Parahalioglobus pacificus TaxID=930806 RepID=A0A918XDS9_9GAMM|nr:taurine dioxygenase [Halioglobus pacificus]NQY02793.1 taurine dioxygenase [Halieaceae bacterium]GHD27365.1 taurine dioxygenase [Halioglobus pacificus]